mmetsp:Transcript_73504/g.237750  ORF Transcript_73504/g.237750 Transcript_73504/m.237750 type:complete len:201 (+) Transcript_73504:254-856(+)
MRASCSEHFCVSSLISESFSPQRRSASSRPALASVSAACCFANSSSCFRTCFWVSPNVNSNWRKWALRSTSSLSVAASSSFKLSILVMPSRNFRSSGSSRSWGLKGTSAWAAPSALTCSRRRWSSAKTASGSSFSMDPRTPPAGAGAFGCGRMRRRSASIQLCVASGFPLWSHSSRARRRTSSSRRWQMPAPSGAQVRME